MSLPAVPKLLSIATAAVLVGLPVMATAQVAPAGGTSAGESLGRKGTRNYRPEGGAATVDPLLSLPDTTPPSDSILPRDTTLPGDTTLPRTGSPELPRELPAVAKRDPLKECMEIWDAATHITKGNWKEICRRQLKERGERLGELNTETKGKKKTKR